MRPADFSYFMVMESRDKPVWVLSDSKFWINFSHLSKTFSK
jgi:hypothetical protein